MFTSSLKLGRISGVAVNLHWSVALIGVLLGIGLAPALGWPAATVAIVAFLASILAHEMAHALVARRFGVGTQSIELWALGGIARLEREAPTPRAEGWIAAAGPLASFGLGALGIGAWLALNAGGYTDGFVRVVFWLGFVNVLLAVFNLLPGAPLDGGRIVKAVRWRMHGDRFRAMRDAGQAGSYLGWGLGGLGLWLTFTGRPGIWLVVTGVFIAVNARAEIMSSYVSERLDGVKVRDLTWFGLAATDADMDADSMLWQRQRLGNAGAVVVQGDDGRPEGLVLEDQLWAIPAEQRPWVMLTQLMIPMSLVARAGPDEELSSVLSRLNPTRPLVTVWDDDRLLGVVPPARLKEQLRAAQQG
ncbi:site-2 protease family protein [soil metagenome]